MRKFVFSSLLLLVALNAFGHAGEVHTYLGTVTTLHADSSFVLTKTDGNTIQIFVSQSTVWMHADGSGAERAELAVGQRVSVTIAKDGQTATRIRIGAVKKQR